MNDVQEVPPSLLFPAIPESLLDRRSESPRREAQGQAQGQAQGLAEDEIVLDKYDIGTLACTD